MFEEKKKLTVIKVGGKIVEEPETLTSLLNDFTKIEGYKVLVHGGGRSATALATRLGVETEMIDGRRVTDAEMLKVVTMIYAGWINKQIVAGLQALGLNALGLTGADLNYMRSEKRPPYPVDYGFVGDVKEVDVRILNELITKDVVPVLAPLTHDKCGNLLNTNADTIAAEAAKAFSSFFEVTLIYCFEKKGVLMNEKEDDSVISSLTPELFEKFVSEKIIQGGMIPKLENSFNALKAGVSKVIITRADAILTHSGTTITL
jgi:acetylglutamate kinase